MIDRQLTIEKGLQILTEEDSDFIVMASATFTPASRLVAIWREWIQAIHNDEYEISPKSDYAQKILINKSTGHELKQPTSDLSYTYIDHERNLSENAATCIPHVPDVYTRRDEKDIIDVSIELLLNAFEHGSNFCESGEVRLQTVATRKGVLTTIIQPGPQPTLETFDKVEKLQNELLAPSEDQQNKNLNYQIRGLIKGAGLTCLAHSKLTRANYISDATVGTIAIMLEEFGPNQRVIPKLYPKVQID